MKGDWRNHVIAGLAGALLLSLWEHARWYLPVPPVNPVTGFPESAILQSVDVFESGGAVIGPALDRPPTEFHDSTVWAEDVPPDTRTGSVVALFDLMGCITHWEFWYERELHQECYARRDGSYRTVFVYYQWISHMGRTNITANDNRTGEIVTPGQALQIMQRDFEAAYSAPERESFEQRWKERHSELAGYLDDTELSILQ